MRDNPLAMAEVIADSYASAGPAALREGLDWYPAAQALAKHLFDDIHLGAGIIAALSPLTPWARNVQLAQMVARGANPLNLPTLGQARRCVDAILRHGSWDGVLRGWKVRAFASGIETAGLTDQVCVDRHARDLAYGVPFTGIGGVRTDESDLTRTEYRVVAHAYRQAALLLNQAAPIVQAVTWVVQRGPVQTSIPVTETEMFLHNRTNQEG